MDLIQQISLNSLPPPLETVEKAYLLKEADKTFPKKILNSASHGSLTKMETKSETSTEVNWTTGLMLYNSLVLFLKTWGRPNLDIKLDSCGWP